MSGWTVMTGERRAKFTELQDAALMMRLTIDKFLHGYAGSNELRNAQDRLEQARVATLLYATNHEEKTDEPT